MNITGKEVTTQDGTQRGVVTDGIPRKSGVYKGRVSVMWIGGRYPVIEAPEDLVAVKA